MILHPGSLFHSEATGNLILRPPITPVLGIASSHVSDVTQFNLLGTTPFSYLSLTHYDPWSKDRFSLQKISSSGSQAALSRLPAVATGSCFLQSSPKQLRTLCSACCGDHTLLRRQQPAHVYTHSPQYCCWQTLNTNHFKELNIKQ